MDAACSSDRVASRDVEGLVEADGEDGAVDGDVDRDPPRVSRADCRVVVGDCELQVPGRYRGQVDAVLVEKRDDGGMVEDAVADAVAEEAAAGVALVDDVEVEAGLRPGREVAVVGPFEAVSGTDPHHGQTPSRNSDWRWRIRRSAATSRSARDRSVVPRGGRAYSP